MLPGKRSLSTSILLHLAPAGRPAAIADSRIRATSAGRRLAETDSNGIAKPLPHEAEIRAAAAAPNRSPHLIPKIDALTES